MKRALCWFVPSLLLVVRFFASCTTSSNNDSVKGSYEDHLDYDKFINPPVQYRSFPFYSLNDSLDEAEIRHQVREFKKAGFGGFYLHSRVGLITEFLGDEWWQVIDAAVQEAKEFGLEACFYDEDKWPSGYAGGIIPKMGEEYRAKCLVRLDKETAMPQGSVLLKQDTDYKYIMYTAAMGNPKFNGTSWVDLFNPEVVRAFIDTAYAPYIERFAHQLPYTYSIFADEPHIHARYFDKETAHQGVLSYSPFVRSRFKALYGYDFLDKVNLLFEEKENWRQVRLHYYQAVATQFETSFTQQISEYCAAHGVKFAGHYLGEEKLQKVRNRIGNSMLHYRHMQQPGIDHLGLSITNSLITARSLSSVANQYGTPRRMSELFGICGQNMNFEDRKWLAGWHTILGINHFCPHLTLYSLKGQRKRDYPPTFSYHQPYWEYNKEIEDYMARISYATTIGQYQPQLLVLNPLESEYLRGREDTQFTTPLLAIMEQLQSAHYDYDLGDEQIMLDTASVTQGQLHIGAMDYQMVLLPDMINIRQSTLDLLLEFHQKGGVIVSIGRFPLYVDGLKDNATLLKLKSKVKKLSSEDIISHLSQLLLPNVSLQGDNAHKVWSQVRKTADGCLVQLCNTSHTEAITFEINSEIFTDHTILWDPSLAQCFSLKKNKKGNFTISLPSSSNVWITTGELSNSALPVGVYQLPIATSEVFELDALWQGKRHDPNALTLDFAQYSTDGGHTFSASEPIIGISQRLHEQNYVGPLMLKYSVEVQQLPSLSQLVVEQPEEWCSIAVNGKQLRFNPEDYYLDPSFHTSPITPYLKKGNNEIVMDRHFCAAQPNATLPIGRYGSEIESIYIIGDFAVRGLGQSTTMQTQRNASNVMIPRPAHGFKSFVITKEKQQFAGNLTLEGYPFYAGEFELTQHFAITKKEDDKRYYLTIPNGEAIVYQVFVNNQDIGQLVYAPFQLDVTEAIVMGDNVLTIHLVNSLRNLLGPHHQQRAELNRVGPHSFTGSGGFPDPWGDANWFDLRVKGETTKLWTDTYYHIPFGFLEKVSVVVSVVD